MTKIIARPLLLAALLLAVVSQSPAARPDDDPFGDANKAVTKTKDDKAPRPRETVEDRIRFEVAVEPKEAKPGQTVRLTVKGTPKPGFYTYPLTQRADDPAQDPSGLSQMEYQVVPGLRPLGPIVESDPELVAGKPDGFFLKHKKPFTWSQDVLILEDAKPGDKTLPLLIKLQVCDEHSCLRGDIHTQAVFRVLDGPAVPLTDELKKRLDAPLFTLKEVPVTPDLLGNGPKPEGDGKDKKVESNGSGKKTETPASTGQQIADAGLIQVVVLAAGAAFLMLLTPCVFPMIPITVSFFLKQSESRPNLAVLSVAREGIANGVDAPSAPVGRPSPVLLASVYALTIIVLLSAAVLLLGGLVISLANNALLNLGMGALLVFFALSLFGMYEIELPHFLSQFTSSREGQGGYVGVFFMALTFTITSFTCTGPFLGPLLVGAKEMQLGVDKLIVAAVAYSATFAAPFFVLALFPSLLKTLPKSGGWLNAIKVVMGFVEIGLAMKFFSIMDSVWSLGNPRWFNYDTVLCSWIVLSAACGLYLLGFFRLPHDTPMDHVGVPRLLFATLFLGLAVYMTPALWRTLPLGAVGENIIAFLPQDTRAPTAGGEGAPAAAGELAWSRDFEQSWEKAKKENKLLFIDFTGMNCQNCRLNEKTVFPRSDVREQLKQFVLVQLYTDVVPSGGATALTDAARNLKWQEKTFNDVSLPLYVVLDPTGATKPVSDDGKLQGVVKGQASGTINNVSDFVTMLARSRDKQLAQRP